MVERTFADKDEAKAYIVQEQLARRNLSPAAESYLRGKRYLAAKQQGARTDLSSGQSDQKTAAERLGEEFKVGEKTIRRDGKFAEAVDCVVENCGTAVRNLLLSRDTGFSRGGVLRLAKLKPEEQRAFMEELKESGKRPRKPRKNKRRETITVSAQPKALVRALCEQLKPDVLAAVYKALGEAIESKKADESQEQGPGQPRKRKRKSAE